MHYMNNYGDLKMTAYSIVYDDYDVHVYTSFNTLWKAVSNCNTITDDL